MKVAFLLAALALTISAALGKTVGLGTTPDAQAGNPSNMPSAGSPIGKAKDDRPDNMSGKNKRMMRKSGRMKTSSDGTTKTTM